MIGKTRVNDTGEETFGMLYFAEITEFAKELHSEMEKVILMDEFPENWTYPLIQPKLIEKYKPVSYTHLIEGQIDDLISEINKEVEKKNKILVTTLTKRMAEDLTDYLKEVGIRAVSYTHLAAKGLQG